MDKSMVLRQTLPEPVQGYWDGGAKQVFDWAIEDNTYEYPLHDSKGEFVCIGSWSANHWFRVAKSKTVKATLANARRHLRALSPDSTFEYIT